MTEAEIAALIQGAAASATPAKMTLGPVQRITGADRLNDPLYGYSASEVEDWIRANNFNPHIMADRHSEFQRPVNEQAALEMARQNDPEFKQVWDSRPKEDLGDRLSGMASGFADGVGNFVEGVGPLAAVAYGGHLATNALAGTGAATGGSGVAGPMAGSGFTGTGPGIATTVAGTGGATNAMLTSSLGGDLTNAITSTGAPVVPGGTPGIPGSTPDTDFWSGFGDDFDWRDLAILGSGLYSDYQSGESHDAATEEISRQFDINQENLAPWQEAGVNALDQLTNFDTDSITNDPMYQHQLGEALRGTERGASARGFNLSTNALNDIATTAANTSSNWGEQQKNDLRSLAGLGQVALNTGIDLGTNTANTLAGFDLSRGSDRNNAVQGTLSNWLTRDYTQNPPGNPWKDYFEMWRP